MGIKTLQVEIPQTPPPPQTCAGATSADSGAVLTSTCVLTRPHGAEGPTVQEAPRWRSPHSAEGPTVQEAPRCRRPHSAEGPTVQEAPQYRGD
ncbi:hypothetical protein INR49_008763 [Caranx melampygus]|nr:hypothetical protein INR49_008763 [Caranx melampygus]